MYKKYPEEAIAALQKAASSNHQEREEAQRAFAAELTAPLRQGVFDRDI